jgi:hypothetical protein
MTVDCQRVDEVLCEAPTEQALAHAKGCSVCGPARAAWNAMDSEAASSGSLEKIREASHAELRAHPKPRPWWIDALILVAMNVGAAALAGAVMSAATRPESAVARWGIAAALIALMGAGAWATVRPGAQLLRFAVLGIAGAGALWIGLGGSGLSGDRPFGSGVGCAITEGVICVAPLLIAMWITSRFAWDLTRAIVGGVSAGATGIFVLHLHCPNGASEHLFAFHVLPWMLVAVAAVVIRRQLPTRSYAP